VGYSLPCVHLYITSQTNTRNGTTFHNMKKKYGRIQCTSFRFSLVHKKRQGYFSLQIIFCSCWFKRRQDAQLPFKRYCPARQDKGINRTEWYWVCTTMPPDASASVGGVRWGQIIVQYRNLLKICPLSPQMRRWQEAYRHRYMGSTARECRAPDFGSVRHQNNHPLFCL
jgi:hypothetical protein